MSDSEEENFCFYGKALDAYDEDLFPKKRPITVEEQIATDSHGRRRFHGAFTGGFSAGFFNTVGSLEGWTPSEFKSGRAEKQEHVVQNPEDFMDDEDMGEFGFAPHSICATKDYDTSKKRKRKTFSDGPIPGEPVLHTLLTAGNETIGYLLLRNIGIKEKMKTRDEEISDNKIYGCEMPKAPEIPESIRNKDFKLPEFYEQILSKPKNDTFGLGYVGLDRSYVNTYKSTDLVVHEKDKKLSIRGQAFGVGAFENDDDDIYSKEDMSNYDFEITKEKEKPSNPQQNVRDVILDIFCKAKVNSFIRQIYPPPLIPKSFTGKHKVKKSRFEPLETPKPREIERNTINPTSRAEILGEETNNTFTASREMFPYSSSKINDENMACVKKEETSLGSIIDESTNSTRSSVSGNSSVQKMSKFDTSDIWNDRFVSAVQADDATNAMTPVKKYEIEHYTKEMRDAAKMKLFGPLTRISEDWHPCSLLCKRFNIAEPMSNMPNNLKNRTRTKNLIFEYQKHHDENIALLRPGLSHPNSSGFSVSDNKNKQNENNEETNLDAKVKQESEDQGCMMIDMKEGGNIENMESNEIDSEEKKSEDIVNVDQVIDITDKLNIEDKGDLFKAIFMSSSESEEEPEENDKLSADKEEEDHDRQLKLTMNVLGEEIMLPKIKPVKDGILSGLDFKTFHKFNKQSAIEKKEINNDNKIPEGNINSSDIHETNMYGPKLPEKKVVETTINSLNRSNVHGDSSDEWVEKEDVTRAKKKKHKKEKSHRKRQKHKKKRKS